MPLTWLVTGCSSGFGTAFVRAIIARGDNCIATGRDIVSKLAHLEKSGAALLELDVTSPQPVIDHQIDKALQLYGRIDVLVNNAGYMMGGFVEELTYVWENTYPSIMPLSLLRCAWANLLWYPGPRRYKPSFRRISMDLLLSQRPW